MSCNGKLAKIAISKTAQKHDFGASSLNIFYKNYFPLEKKRKNEKHGYYNSLGMYLCNKMYSHSITVWGGGGCTAKFTHSPKSPSVTLQIASAHIHIHNSQHYRLFPFLITIIMFNIISYWLSLSISCRTDCLCVTWDSVGRHGPRWDTVSPLGACGVWVRHLEDLQSPYCS